MPKSLSATERFFEQWFLVERQETINVKFCLPVLFYEAYHARRVYGSKYIKIFIDKGNNSIQRTGENIIYCSNPQNENETG